MLIRVIIYFVFGKLVLRGFRRRWVVITFTDADIEFFLFKFLFRLLLNLFIRFLLRLTLKLGFLFAFIQTRPLTAPIARFLGILPFQLIWIPRFSLQYCISLWKSLSIDRTETYFCHSRGKKTWWVGFPSEKESKFSHYFSVPNFFFHLQPLPIATECRHLLQPQDLRSLSKIQSFANKC